MRERKRDERTPVLQMVFHGAIASAIGIAVGLAIDWFPEGASTQAGPIDTLWDVLIVVSVPIFVTVSIIVLFSVRNFGMRPGEENLDGPPIHGNTRLEIVWTAIPAIILVALCTYAYVVLVDIEEAQANEMRINVVGQQFTWTFEYPQAGGKPVRSQQLYLPQDRPVRFYVKSLDVIHDFWVPAFRMKVDAVPGIETRYRVTPDRRGTYPVVCAELCGLGHAFMRVNAHVVSPQAFKSWLTKQKQPAQGASAEGEAPDGKALFAEGNGDATACGACHTLADAGTNASIGPDLDEALPGQDAAAIKASIVKPNAELSDGFQAGVMPPNYGDTLSPEELDALVEYLGEVAGK
ncbi:MAG: cytochrome c oxidase subunit II [Solirubrobacterales bacterium]|nr:cytochrome c oxidase subunit II [Solirubrobacterales bacterium]